MASSSQSSSETAPTNFSFVNLGTDGRSWQDVWGKPPRPRKRITKEQLKKLEGLYERETHPTREERMLLAQQIGMELRSVTIWLQNKRQIVRKNALAAVAADNSASPVSSSASSPLDTTPTLVSSGASTCSDDSVETPAVTKPRPSLDRVASLSELPSPARAAQWDAQNGKTAEIWNLMPSSPPSSPPSAPHQPLGRHRSAHAVHKTSGRPYPLTRTSSLDSAASVTSNTSSRKTRDREMAKYRRPSRTLEWACAHASQRTQSREEQDDGEVTEKEEDDNIAAKSTEVTAVVEESDKTNAEMQAALALCGLINGQ